ncbi:MAG TPA: hypothetical protein VLC52_09630, partial [Anaerolineae bacterium]|nr:hypothetical protein [Anaerolineae bacterium]
KEIATRWQRHQNIAIWEIYSEVNLTRGVAEENGVAFVERAAAAIREADPALRPVTASLADVGEWPTFYQSDALDLINIHPYPPSGKLDQKIIADVRALLGKYQKPVMIGESGLSAETPDRRPATLTTAARAEVGLRHAIWAALVSGAMNGRAFYWEDGYAIYFPGLSWWFLEKYAAIERPAADFARDLRWDLAPIDAHLSSRITGAALGNDTTVAGWFRDAGCEPPNWLVQPVLSGESVTLDVPGSAITWQVDFYDPTTGTGILPSATATRQGSSVRVELPDFSDAIAFKMHAQAGSQDLPAAATPRP